MRVVYVFFSACLLVFTTVKGQQVFISPPMVDTAWVAQQQLLDTTLKASFCMRNTSALPTNFRFLLNWPGREHILDSDSALLSWMGENAEVNVPSLFKTLLMGVNRHNFIEEHLAVNQPKKLRLAEYILGFSGRLCRDYADLTAYVFKYLGGGYVLYSDVQNNLNAHAMISRLQPEKDWLAYDADPSTPYLQYNSTLEHAVHDSSVLWPLAVWKDTASPYAGVEGTLQMMPTGKFFQQYLRDATNSESRVPDAILNHTDNTLVLCSGCEIRYEIENPVYLINEDRVPQIRTLLAQLKDSTSTLCWNIYDVDSLTAAVKAVNQALVVNALPDFDVAVQNAYLSGTAVHAISSFSQFWDIPIGLNRYQLLQYVIPPHTDTLYAGVDYRVPFWVEKTENANGIIGNVPAFQAGLTLVDSLAELVAMGGLAAPGWHAQTGLHNNPGDPREVPAMLDSWHVNTDKVQTLTEGYLTPNADTTRIWLHFNPGIIRLTTGTNYQVLKGAQPVITTTAAPAVTGVNALAAEKIIAYPNPTTGKIFLRGLPPGAVINLFDMAGRQIAAYNAGLQGNAVLDIAGHAPGMYIMRSGAYSGKIILRP